MSVNRLQKGDYIICFAVFIQPVLILMQHVLIDVFRVDPDTTTTYRVVLTAIPMIVAIGVGAYRRFVRFAVVYIIAFLVLLSTCLFFPDNETYVRHDGIRFLVPLIIPSAVCLTTVNHIEIVKKSLGYIAWLGAFVVLIYTFSYFAGLFVIDSYNMSFSYGCLLPMIILYSQRRVFSTLMSFFLFVVVLAIGSRGGAYIYVAYLIIDALVNRRKGWWLMLVLGGISVLFIPFLMTFLVNKGINSRTLGMINSGDIIYGSGRENIYITCINALSEHPITGCGLFGDRVLLDGAYCHNFFLEIGLDFGLLFGGAIILVLAICFVRSWTISKGDYRDLLLVITFGCFMPFLASGSYLVSNSIALWIGIMLLIIKYGNLDFHSYINKLIHR